MRTLTFVRRVAIAVLIAAPLAGAQAPAYSLEDLEGMLKNRVPQKRIIDLAGRRCIAFVVDSKSEGRLREVGASTSFVDQLKEVCNPNMPRREAAASSTARPAAPPPAAPVEQAINVSFVAAIIDSNLTVRPIPQHDLIVMGPRGDTSRISTSLQGEASAQLLPGIYRIESAAAIEVQGSRYRWSMFIPIQAGMKPIELTQRNATVEAVLPPAPVAAAAAPPPPARSRKSEEAELFDKYRSGLFTVYGEEGRATGFLIDSAGLVLTQAHAVRGGNDIRVQIDSATRVRARVIARDTLRDVAVLAINPSRCGNCTPVALFDSAGAAAEATVGERVLAVGSPLNRAGLMSIGIVNSVDGMNVTSDVNVSAFNAGGPLLNLDGRAVAVNIFNDGRRVGRPKTSMSLPIGAISGVLRNARDSIAALRTNPPTDSLIPLAPVEQFPAEPIAALVAAKEPKLEAYHQNVENSRIFMMTPQVMGWRQARANAELTKRRAEGKTRGIVDDRVDPIQLWSDWNDYLNARKAVVVFNVVPASTEFPFYEVEKVVEPNDGSIRRVKIFRDGSEIVPIETVRIPAALTGAERLALGRPVAYQVINVYRASDFGPKPDGSQPSFTIAIERFSHQKMPAPVVLERKMVDLIIRDFTPFFVGLRMR